MRKQCLPPLLLALCGSIALYASAKGANDAPEYIPSPEEHAPEEKVATIELPAEPCKGRKIAMAIVYKEPNGTWKRAGTWCARLKEVATTGFIGIPPEESSETK